MRYAISIIAPMLLAGCSETADETRETSQSGSGNLPSEANSSADAKFVTVEGLVEEGAECDIIRTPDGQVWAVNFGEADPGPGDYIRIGGTIADAGFCLEGRGTLIPKSIDTIDPPAADRDPARAGGIALNREYVTGDWVAKGLDADCSRPDFRIMTSPAGTVLKGEISRHDNSAMVLLDNYPRIDLDEPMDDLPIEARGPDGLAILRPATDAVYNSIAIGTATIEGDGTVFVKCA
jgi:hypothetical protein